MTRRPQAEQPVIRRAVAADIDRLMVIRGSVLQNRLSDAASVRRPDYEWFVSRGLVWVAAEATGIAGFSAGDPRDGTIWALFVDPAREGQGFGRQLLGMACADLKAAGFGSITLSTDPGTKAARLYLHLGWQDRGLRPDGEVEFARQV